MKMLKRMFQLTDKGTAGIVKASIASFFSYCSLMIPMILLMLSKERKIVLPSL